MVLAAIDVIVHTGGGALPWIAAIAPAVGVLVAIFGLLAVVRQNARQQQVIEIQMVRLQEEGKAARWAAAQAVRFTGKISGDGPQQWLLAIENRGPGSFVEVNVSYYPGAVFRSRRIAPKGGFDTLPIVLEPGERWQVTGDAPAAQLHPALRFTDNAGQHWQAQIDGLVSPADD